jgi:hypothetical protein
MEKKIDTDKPIEMRSVKKIVVNRLNTRTGIKALGGDQSNDSCFSHPICHTK